MIKDCPQYKYTLEEQTNRFPYFPESAYTDLEELRCFICHACISDEHSAVCPRTKKPVELPKKNILTNKSSCDTITPSKGRKTDKTRKEMINMEKMTYVNAIDAVLAGNVNDEVLSRLTELKASLSKKTVSKAQRAKIDARESDKEAVRLALDLAYDWMSIGELLSSVGVLEGKSAQYVSRLLTDLKSEGKIDRKVDKGKVYFRIAE